MPIRLCMEPRCPNEATGRGRCDFHRKQLERERSRARREDAKQRNRLYASKKWAMTRRKQLLDFPACQYKLEDGRECGRLANTVHHKVDLADGGAVHDPQNLSSLCKPHHDRITRQRMNDRGEGGGDVPPAA